MNESYGATTRDLVEARGLVREDYTQESVEAWIETNARKNRLRRQTERQIRGGLKRRFRII